MRRILAIDGGGIKGVFPASFLANVEELLSQKVSEYFDLIVGTSTGGIIALALGLGLSAKEILAFYEEHGPSIFYGSPRSLVRGWFRAKYDPRPLRAALQQVFGERTLGESSKRLVIPSLNIDNGEVHVWKTSHHPRFERDYQYSAMDVALSTAAAPTFFPTHRLACGTPLIDGGLWANNPVAVALVEAVGILKWPADSLRVLSLGCTATPLDVDWGRRYSLGKFGWAEKIADVFMTGQSSGALGMAAHLIGDRRNLVRISPFVGKRYELDSQNEIPSLKGLGASEARQAISSLKPIFFEEQVTPDFKPYHSSS
jgi:uncharacterized protein